MNAALDDWALLRRYAEHGCEESFAALVARHIHYVHSVARRECAGPHLAEEVTQATFIILAQKAGRLPSGTVLSGWLFRTVRYVARNARRAEQRRRIHEEEVAHMSAHEPQEETLWEQVSPLLNDAMAALSHADRDAITLRFFEKKSHAEIADALRTNETAARKRLSRALDRLRGMLSRRGVVLSSAALGTLLTNNAVEAAPVALIAGVTSAAMNAGSSTSTLAATTLQLMAWSKLKVAGTAALALLLAGGATMLVSNPRQPDDPMSRKLPDGSILTVTKVEMATRAEFRFPERPPKKGPGRTSGSITLTSFDSPETLFVGTAQEGGDGSAGIGRLQVASDDGSVFDGVFASGTLGVTDGSLQAWRVHAFPRRGTNLTLRFFYPNRRGTWVNAAEFTVPNPAPGTFDEWQPNPLPAATTNGDLVVSLVEFDAGAPQQRHRDGMSSFWKNLPGTHCAFTLRQAGKGVAPWDIRSLELSDATGNHWKARDLVSWVDDGPQPRLHASMPGALWANEPAWNLRVELTRTNDFSTNELVTLSNIPVPRRDEVIDLREMHLVNGVDLEVTAIAGPEAELAQPHKWRRIKGTMNLAFTAHGELDGRRLSLVSVRDDRGRPVPFTDKRDMYAKREWVFGVEAPSDARALQVTLAVHESRFVEFRARPEQVE